MDIGDTRKCNLFNLKALAAYMRASSEELISYYDELLDDQEFLNLINVRISEIKSNWGFQKGIFALETIPSVDWFAFERVLIYVLIRHLKPHEVLETGVYYGGNTAFALLAINRNKVGKLVSIDYPDYTIRHSGLDSFRHSLVGESELYDPTMRPGFMIPEYLKINWELIEGDSLKVIPSRKEKFDMYIHDSDHSMKFLTLELAAAWETLSKNALILVDDIDWSNAFYAFCVKKRLFPFLMTDNGKDNLRVRTGIAMLEHIQNNDDQYT